MTHFLEADKQIFGIPPLPIPNTASLPGGMMGLHPVAKSEGHFTAAHSAIELYSERTPTAWQGPK
jgi:hypothetical protein